MPWTSIYVEPDGRTDTCCISHNELGNVKNTDIVDLINSEKNIDIKQSMLDGIKVKGCETCYSQENTNKNAFVLRKNMLAEQFNLKDTNIYNDPVAHELKYADLRFRNTCNYACVYCNSKLSSTWAAEQKMFYINDSENINNLVKYFCDHATTLEKVYLAGGEPLLIKENEIILERLLQVNPQCQILVNTNLSVIKNNRIFDLLLKFKHVQWLISAEDMYERYEYIRYPGVWSNFDNNLKFLKANLLPTQEITFNMVYLSLNAKTLFNWIDYLLSLGFKRSVMSVVLYNMGQQLSPYDARVLPKKYINEAIELAKKYVGTDRVGTQIQSIVDCLSVPINTRFNLFNQLKHLDQARNLHSEQIFLDIYAARQ
jgi:MoaA/NifB/PqqE/SkfB family radical SAM enzyme